MDLYIGLALLGSHVSHVTILLISEKFQSIGVRLIQEYSTSQTEVGNGTAKKA